MARLLSNLLVSGRQPEANGHYLGSPMTMMLMLMADVRMTLSSSVARHGDAGNYFLLLVVMSTVPVRKSENRGTKLLLRTTILLYNSDTHLILL